MYDHYMFYVCFAACHLSYHSSGTNLITFIYYNKDFFWIHGNSSGEPSIYYCQNTASKIYYIMVIVSILQGTSLRHGMEV